VSIFDERDIEVFGWKGGHFEAQKPRIMELDRTGCVKKEDLRLIKVNRGVRGFTKVMKDDLKFKRFSNSGGTHHEGIIYKLVMGERGVNSMQGKSHERAFLNGNFDIAT
jgi:hypothetical protein